jgi:hypothetical protein
MFKDPIKIKSQKPQDEKKNPWTFKCPQYDNRSSCFVKAGTDYGMGHRQPVGSIGAPKSQVDVLPKNGAMRMEVQDDVEKY